MTHTDKICQAPLHPKSIRKAKINVSTHQKEPAPHSESTRISMKSSPSQTPFPPNQTHKYSLFAGINSISKRQIQIYSTGTAILTQNPKIKTNHSIDKLFIASQSNTTTPPIMTHLSSPSVDRYEEKVCEEIFMNQNQPNHLVQIFARRSSDEKRRIKQSYRAIYGEELIEHLLRLKEANPESKVYCGLWLWMMEPPERDAVVAKDAVERRSADAYNSMVELYVRRKTSHLFNSKQAYLAKFRRQLDKDIVSVELENRGSKIIAALANSHRSYFDEEISQHIGNCDAKRLNEALKRSGGIDEGSIIEIFSKRSIAQLRLAFYSYRRIFGEDYIEALEKRSGDFEGSLRIAIQCMCAPHKYYSEMIHKSLIDEANKKMVLTRVMIGSVEAGMNKVKETFQMSYKVKLEEVIVERVNDDEDYRDFLLALSETSE